MHEYEMTDENEDPGINLGPMPRSRPVLKIALSRDEETKVFTFSPEVVRSYEHWDHPGSGRRIRWGDIAANAWFICASGRSWREAASIAQRQAPYRLAGVKSVNVTWELETR